jgi:hypothetical protein
MAIHYGKLHSSQQTDLHHSDARPVFGAFLVVRRFILTNYSWTNTSMRKRKEVIESAVGSREEAVIMSIEDDHHPKSKQRKAPLFKVLVELFVYMIVGIFFGKIVSWGVQIFIEHPLIKATYKRTINYAMHGACARKDVQSSLRCLDDLGKEGKWVQNFTFAKEYGQYPEPLVVPFGPHADGKWSPFEPSEEAPFRWETSWVWNDNNEDNANCQIDHTLTPDSFCKLIAELKIDRIFLHGDYTTETHFKALINKFGPQKAGDFNDKERHFTANIRCWDQSKPQTIPVRLAKDEVGGSSGEPRKVTSLSEESKTFLQASSSPVLVIFNLGTYYKVIDQFQQDLDAFVKELDGLKLRQDDMVFFRTTPIGHNPCVVTTDTKKGTREKPWEDYGDIPPSKLGHEWFEHHNDYLQKVLSERNSNTNMQQKPEFRLLDVYKFTSMRKDGHISRNDCILYFTRTYPTVEVYPDHVSLAPHLYTLFCSKAGVPDWWNHLMYTHLLAIVKMKKITGSLSCGRYDVL